jgi:NDP-sugar pyrophosphorylase family protein
MAMVDVVILAAGQGTRLRPLTHDRPKSMLLAAGEPLIHHLLSDLRDVGADAVVLVVGHGHDALQSFVGDGSRYGLKVRYVQQPKQLGPGHALHLARDAIRGDEFVLLPADAWYAPTVLAALLDTPGPALIQVPDARAARHGLPVVRGTEVVDLEPPDEAPGAGHPSGGAYRLHRRILDLLPGAQYQLARAIRNDIKTDDGWRAIPVPAKAYLDIFEVQDVLDLHSRLIEHGGAGIEGTVEPGVHMQGLVRIGKGSVIRAGAVLQGPVIVGEHCDVGPCAVLQPGTALRNHVRVGPFSLLSHCILHSNVTVGSHARVHRAYVDRGAELGSGCHVPGGTGSIVGADAQLGSDCRIEAGGLVGNGARVAAGRAVHSVPDKGIAV